MLSKILVRSEKCLKLLEKLLLTYFQCRDVCTSGLHLCRCSPMTDITLLQLV